MLKKIAAALLFCALSMAAADHRVYELRTYYTLEGRLDALLARFRDHTTKLFEKHGIENVGYWVPNDKPNTLIYIVVHKDLESAKANWDAFRKDPDWIKARTASEAGGKIVDRVESVYMSPTAFSKLK
jgi:hypothetical protein